MGRGPTGIRLLIQRRDCSDRHATILGKDRALIAGARCGAWKNRDKLVLAALNFPPMSPPAHSAELDGAIRQAGSIRPGRGRCAKIGGLALRRRLAIHAIANQRSEQDNDHQCDGAEDQGKYFECS